MEDSDNHIARLGSNILVDINNGDRLTFARLHPSATLKIGSTRCSLAPLIGSPYGSVFELQKGPKGPCLVRIPATSKETALAQTNDGPASRDGLIGDPSSTTEIIQRDNRNLVDDNTAQKLSADDISRMRRDCLSGKEIIEALLEHSTTFHNKTAYSQEKYKVKKQKKYAPCLVLRRPSARRICETYFMKSPQKIGFMRMDMLGLMLSLANVGAHTEVLVMDMVGGLLTAAVAERIGGFGSVCSVYHSGKPPPMDIVGLLNFSSAMASRIFRASIWDVSAAFKQNATNTMSDITNSVETMSGLQKSCTSSDSPARSCDITMNDVVESNSEKKDDEAVYAEDGNAATEAGRIAASVHCTTCQEAVSTVQDGTTVCVDEDLVAADNCQDHCRNRIVANARIKPWRHASSSEISMWAKYGFTSLLIGTPEMEPWSIAQELLPLLCCSSPFVIYHSYLQPLVECMHQLQANKMAVALEILEPWLREYQVLPSRTHPLMQMNANGGYVLSGIKVATV